MWKWNNSRSYGVVTATDQQVVTNPESHFLPLEEKINAMLRVVAELAEEVSTIQNNVNNMTNSSYKINNIDSTSHQIQYDTQNILNSMRNIERSTEVISRTPYNIDEINNNIIRIKSEVEQVVRESKMPENAELIATVKTLLALARSDKLGDLIK